MVLQFGLGGLLQAAEMAWQQNTDIYKAGGYALASAMELHARIINAWDANKTESLLPAGYKFFETSMPLAPQVMLNGYDRLTAFILAGGVNCCMAGMARPETHLFDKYKTRPAQ